MLASSLLAASILAFAVAGDIDQPICVGSDQQFFDMQDNVVTFTGNVIITQGTIKTNADKVAVTRPGDKQGKEVVDGYGKPIASCQTQDSGKLVKGHASQIYYELARDFVILAGNAYLQQVDSNIRGGKTTYLAREQRMQVFSDKGKRVTIVLVPSQPQDKNNGGQTPVQKGGS